MQTQQLNLDLRSYRQESNSHQHNYHQLVLPVNGTLEMSIGKQANRVQQQTAAVVAAGHEHGFCGSPDNCFVVADIPAALAPELEKLPAFIALDSAMAQYVQFLYLQLQQGAGHSQKQMLLLLIQLLQERYGQPLNLDKRVNAAREYLDQYYDRQISLAQLSAVAHLSQRQLSKLFKQQLGMTPQQYLIEKRMQMAWQLLEQSPLSVQQIADRVGYRNLSAFSDRFRKHFNQSPRHLRQLDNFRHLDK